MAEILLRHEGFVAVIAYDELAETFRGRVTNVSADIVFSGSSVKELQLAFRRAVAAYRLTCAAAGATPETPP